MIKICIYCCIEFNTQYTTQKYCNKKCRNNAKAKKFFHKKTYSLICDWCKSPFNGGRKDTLNCSKDCALKSIAKKLTKFLDIPACLNFSSRKLDKNIGYVRVYVPMHPEANSWGYVYEHRVIAEKMIGRSLEKNEIVHHKNGKRWDNRPENLEVMNASDHGKLQGQRKEDLSI